MLRGYPLEIRNEEHRAALLRDCRYFHLRGLEQMLIPHHIRFDVIDQQSEIMVHLEDVRQSGVGIRLSMDNPPTETGHKAWKATYARPFTDTHPHELIVQTGADEAMIDPGTSRVQFFGATHEKIHSLLQLMVNQMDPSPDTPSASINKHDDHCVHVDDADLTMNGKRIDDVAGLCREAQGLRHARPGHGSNPPPPKRQRMTQGLDRHTNWTVRTGQWGLGVVLTETGVVEVMIVGVKLDVYTELKDRNRATEFLS